MPLNYYTVQPDSVYLVKGNHTRGRGGARIEHVTRHHLAYIGDGKAVVDNIWNHPTYPRAASATAVIGPKGHWTQTVWDDNTSWADASGWSNRRAITLEHSNSTGLVGGSDNNPRSWNISDETIISGARVAAAYCLNKKLGVPRFGTNIRDHRDVSELGTSCPFHLANGGMYHRAWMEEAIWFYGQLDKRLVNPDGSPIIAKFDPPKKEPLVMATHFDSETTAQDGTTHTYGQLVRYTDNRVYIMEKETLPRIIKGQEELNAKLDKILALVGLDNEDEGVR